MLALASRRYIGKQTLLAAIEPLENRLLMSTNMWKAAVSGNWNDPANWSLNHVPTASENVAIILPGNYTVSVYGTSAVAKNIALGSGSTEPTLDLISDDIHGSAALTVADGFANNGKLILANNSVSDNYPTLTVTAGAMENAVGAVIIAAGSINSLYGDYLYSDAGITNAGTINVIAPKGFSLSAPSGSNAGTINLTSGSLYLNGSGLFTNTGNIRVSAGETFFIGGGTFDQTAGILGGAEATLSLSYVTLNLATPFSTSSGNLTTAYSTINDSAGLTNATGHTLTLTFSTLNGPLINRGTVNAYGSTDHINGPLTATAGSNINVISDARPNGSATLSVANGFTNYGNITLTNDSIFGYASSLVIGAGTLVNAAGATIAAAGSGAADSDIINGDLNNAGTLAVTAAKGLSINGSFVQTASGVYQTTLPLPGTAISGTASLGGTLAILTSPGFQPVVGGSYPVMTYAGVSGNFANLVGGNPGGGVVLIENEGATAYTLAGITA